VEEWEKKKEQISRYLSMNILNIGRRFFDRSR
jgi:hypothetical protein